MAANTLLSEVDYTCPVCCDIFKDPVVLLCGHSFCKYCLQEWWRQSGLQTCPMCKEIFPMAQPPRNLKLRDLSDTFRRERSQRASGSKEICSLHSEKLKLFCEDDQQLICVICRDAKKHKKHNCVPLNEAAEDHRLQAQQMEKTIREEFQKLYQFLRAEEAARIDAVRKEAALKSEAMNIRIVNLTAEISSITDKIETIQREMKAEDISFMLSIKSTMERFQFTLPKPVTPSGALMEEAKHLGNLLFTVWKKMMNMIQYTPVTLDSNTGASLLTISEHMTRSAMSDKSQPLPRNPERLDSSEILGSEGFRSGKHSWDVEVGGFWSVGVADKTKDQRKIWRIFIHDEKTVCEHTPGNNDQSIGFFFLQRVRVQLDYDRGTLSFFDLDKKRNVHTIKHTFTETVFPYFCENAKILPAKLSVTISQPR